MKLFFVRFQCEFIFRLLQKGSSGNYVCVVKQKSLFLLIFISWEFFVNFCFCTVSFMLNWDGIFACLHLYCGNYWLWFTRIMFGGHLHETIFLYTFWDEKIVLDVLWAGMLMGVGIEWEIFNSVYSMKTWDLHSLEYSLVY